ncbi:hypothetical protein AQUCO_01400825v1 [Aquilegia coerulea]|uniref:Uncharacterized protein n=1 Tax=Aquilegia coerulea TaxID=218851 RepID=A0A2G5DYG9_AQUCA|nr:hypothetical protein AQUCO_01400825v1 [Aquilegia coerulea]
MPESRDRLIREEPLTPIFTRRSLSGVINREEEEEEERRSSVESISATPTGRIQYNTTPWEFTVNRKRRRTTTTSRDANRNTSSLLPSWYPRRPLQDITAVMDAIERRRARLRDLQKQEDVSPLQQAPVAPLEHNISLATPKLPLEHSISLATLKLGEGSEFVTPQKKLINSIDVVEKAFKEELKKMKNTPAAKRAEREKKVRVVMAMR